MCRFLEMVILAIFLGFLNCAKSYEWREGFYRDMPLDHFGSDGNKTGKTFDLRYLINDTWWDSNGGPILFYPGNEGAVEDFAEHTGLMWEWAPQLGAMLVFVEHRFYGRTLPYGNLSYELPYLKTMTIDQTMEDFAVFIKWLKHNTTGASNSSVIAVGGSYGGMLAAWMRLKYPQIVQGAIASSAPINQLIGGDAPCWTFGERATKTYAKANPKCVDAIQRSGEVMREKLYSDEGRKWLNKNFHMCNKTQVRDGPYVEVLLYRINDALTYMAMFDYPYATDFVAPMPAWPVKEACKHFTAEAKDNETLLLNAFKAISVYYNGTGAVECFSLRRKVTDGSSQNWAYQTCTELVFRMCMNESDVLQDSPWDEVAYFNACRDALGSESRGDYITKHYGVKKLRKASNIIFSNSELDPWFDSGIRQDQLVGADPSLIVINIPNSAHHYELRPSHPKDTREVIEARQRMKRIVRGWLSAESTSKKASASSTGVPLNCNNRSYLSSLAMSVLILYLLHC